MLLPHSGDGALTGTHVGVGVEVSIVGGRVELLAGGQRLQLQPGLRHSSSGGGGGGRNLGNRQQLPPARAHTGAAASPTPASMRPSPAHLSKDVGAGGALLAVGAPAQRIHRGPHSGRQLGLGHKGRQPDGRAAGDRRVQQQQRGVVPRRKVARVVLGVHERGERLPRLVRGGRLAHLGPLPDADLRQGACGAAVWRDPEAGGRQTSRQLLLPACQLVACIWPSSAPADLRVPRGLAGPVCVQEALQWGRCGARA